MGGAIIDRAVSAWFFGRRALDRGAAVQQMTPIGSWPT
jgi:hypothetical protein